MSDKKSIKTEIRNQIKSNKKIWNCMTKKEKKKLCHDVMAEVKKRYEDNSLPTFTTEELLNIALPPKEIMTLDDMKRMKNTIKQSIAFYMDPRKTSYMDPELRQINSLLDDVILNQLLAPSSYSPAQREKTPAMFFRAELLHSLKRAELSYRKFCTEEINNLERKNYRTFIGLPLNRKVNIYDSELCAFRKSMTLTQQLNVLVYIISLLFETDLLGKNVVWGIDATDLAAKIKSHPIASISVTIDGKKEKISIYDQLDTDCGERRNKSDRSRFYVGYKVHTLSVINPITQMAYPLFSLLAPANHHDTPLLKPVIAFGKALGLELSLVVVDEGYDCSDHEMMDTFDVTIVAPRRKRVTLPQDVEIDTENTRVYCHADCSTPMHFVGRDGGFVEFHCGDESNKCPFRLTCSRGRFIALDNGCFGPLPTSVKNRDALESTRKVIERPFNYIKNRNGQQRITVKSQHSAQVVETISVIAVLLIEIAGQRKEKQIVSNQFELALTG